MEKVDNWEEIKYDENWTEVLDMLNAMLDKTEAAQLVYELKKAVKNEALQILRDEII
jgi:hypothetical protein